MECGLFTKFGASHGVQDAAGVDRQTHAWWGLPAITGHWLWKTNPLNFQKSIREELY